MKPEETFYVGDMAEDLHGAHNAGIRFIFVKTGVGIDFKKEKLKPYMILDKLSTELPKKRLTRLQTDFQIQVMRRK